MTGTPGERMAEEAAAMRRIPSTPEQRAEAADARDRAQRAATTLRLALRAAIGDDLVQFTVEGYDSLVVVRIPHTDAFLAAVRLVQVTERGAHRPPAGEGEPEHYEAIDAEPEDRCIRHPLRAHHREGECEAARLLDPLRGPAWPPPAERRLPDREPTIADWREAHRGARRELGRSAHWRVDRATLVRHLPEEARRYVEHGDRLRAEQGTVRRGW